MLVKSQSSRRCSAIARGVGHSKTSVEGSAAPVSARRREARRPAPTDVRPSAIKGESKWREMA